MHLHFHFHNQPILLPSFSSPRIWEQIFRCSAECSAASPWCHTPHGWSNEGGCCLPFLCPHLCWVSRRFPGEISYLDRWQQNVMYNSAIPTSLFSQQAQRLFKSLVSQNAVFPMAALPVEFFCRFRGEGLYWIEKLKNLGKRSLQCNADTQALEIKAIQTVPTNGNNGQKPAGKHWQVNIPKQVQNSPNPELTKLKIDQIRNWPNQKPICTIFLHKQFHNK